MPTEITHTGFAAVKAEDKGKIHFQDEEWFAMHVGDILRMPVCKHAWVLGAGASRDSGIPVAADLAKQWYQEIADCKDRHRDPCETDCERCAVKDGFHAGFAEEYFRIFERRFAGDQRAGHFALLNKIDGAAPSYGYMVLAEIMHRSSSKLAITVNFDNLLADALHLVSDKAIQVIGHERIADCVNHNWGIPVVCKLHRDLTMQPLNRSDEIERLDKSWESALDRVFADHTPIFIGYGGNDRSLMGYLERNYGKSKLSPIWLEFDPEHAKRPNESLLPERVLKFLRSNNGIIVKHSGFDRLFKFIQLRVMKDFDPVSAIEVYSSRLIGTITRSFQRTADQFIGDESASKLVEQVRSKNQKFLDDYLIIAAREPNLSKKKQIYNQAIRQISKKRTTGARLELSRLYNNLANVHLDGKEQAPALKCLSKAIELWPEYSVAIYNRACCYARLDRVNDCIEDLSEAIRLDPTRKERAQADPDLDSVRGLSSFRRIVGIR